MSEPKLHVPVTNGPGNQDVDEVCAETGSETQNGATPEKGW